jgi:hypothetical protein
MTSRFQQPTSLEMLLDTMCNAFGGIILIALLITLIAREMRRTEIDEESLTRSRGMVAWRLAQAERDLAAARVYREDLVRRRNDPEIAERYALVEQRQQLRRRIQGLADETSAGEAALTAEAANAASNLNQLLETLLIEHDALHREWIEEQNRHGGLQAAISNLQTIVASAETQLRNAARSRTRQFRLPREHSTLKRPWHIIVRFGRLYPVNFMVRGTRERNTATIHWRPGPDDEEVAQPIPGRGLDPGTPGGALTVALTGLSSDDYYLVYNVYADSFGAFVKARDGPLEQGFEMGWVPLENHMDLLIQPASGEAPPRPL